MMKKFKNILWVLALIVLIVLIAGIAYGYYRNATTGSKKSNSYNRS